MLGYQNIVLKKIFKMFDTELYFIRKFDIRLLVLFTNRKFNSYLNALLIPLFKIKTRTSTSIYYALHFTVFITIHCFFRR